MVRGIPPDAVETILVVDDGSTDDSVQRAREAGASIVQHKENRGVGAAIRTGIEYAIREGYQICVIVSGSGKTPGAQIPLLLFPILHEGYDFVQGSRYLPGGGLTGAPRHRRLGTRLYSLLFSVLAGRRVSDASSGFRAFRVRILEDTSINLWQEWLNTYELEPYLLYKVTRSSVRCKDVPVTITYPSGNDGLQYTKMRIWTDWWRIFRPVVYLRLRIKL